MSIRNSMNFSRLTVNQYPFVILSAFQRNFMLNFFLGWIRNHCSLGCQGQGYWRWHQRKLHQHSERTAINWWCYDGPQHCHRSRYFFDKKLPVLKLVETTAECLTDCLGCRGVLPCSANPPPIPFDACCGGCPAGKLFNYSVHLINRLKSVQTCSRMKFEQKNNGKF